MADQPAKKFRIGYVTATVWKNDGVDRPFYSVDVTRSFKDDNDEWKNTSSLNQGDLLNAAKCLMRAEAWIADQ